MKLWQEVKSLLNIRSTKEPYLRGDSAVAQMFGSIARNQVNVTTNVDFIPEDGQSNIIPLREKGAGDPQWLGLNSLEMQHWAYIYCSPLAAVIDKLAEADTNGVLEIRDAEDNPVKNANKIPALKRVFSLLANPNPLQTWEEFNAEQVILAKKHGYCPVFAICPAGFDKTYTQYLFNLNPLFCKPVTNPNYSLFKDPNPILHWNITIFGENKILQTDDILLVKDGFTGNSNNLGLPISKIAGLDYMVSNICAAMEADNVLLKKKGPLGIFSYDAKPDMAGWMPMSTDEKDELQAALQKYGLSWEKFQYIISRQPIKWNAMSFNVRDLMTKETVRQAIDGICDRFGYPAELMSGKNATYENRTSAEKFLYQNNVIPFSLRRMARYNKFFGLEDYKLLLHYEHLPVLQEDIMHAGQARQALSAGLDVDWKNDMITQNEYRKSLDQDPITGGDIYYSQWAKNNKIDLNGTPPKNTSTQK